MTREHLMAFNELGDEPETDRHGRPNGPAKSKRRFNFKAFADHVVTTTPNYLVKGIIPRGGLSIVWGPPKCGKSFTVFDMAMHVAIGRLYRGRKVQQGAVCYLALEGGGRFSDRIVAWKQKHLGKHREPVPLFTCDDALNLITDHKALIADIQAQTPDPALVVIDTLNRSLVGSESKDEDMAKYIGAADAIRRAFNCAVVIIHHCGHAGERPRGHSSLPGADDAQIAVSRDSNDLITITTEHMKDDQPGQPLNCRLEVVQVGTDDDEDPITSCVVVPVDTPTPKPNSGHGGRLTSEQNRFLDILKDAVLDAPAQHKTTSGIPRGQVGISREWLKTCCNAKGWFDESDTPSARRSKVTNFINKLAGKHRVGATKLFVWPVP
jgi:AAA domain